jgi:hypothetical protein
MFGINIYAIIAMVSVVLFCGGFVNGCSYQQSKAEKAIRDKEHQYQSDADKIRTDKDAQIKVINTQLVDAVSQLRSRSSRTSEASNGQTGQGCNGSQLYAEDSIFLTREAARADTIRIALKACYDQYESLK